MKKNSLTADMIEKITIHSTTVTYHHTSWEYEPKGITSAQMNMQYVVAITALEGNIFIDQFTEEKTKDPRVIEYTRKVEVIPDPELDKLGPDFRHCIVAEVKTKKGDVFKERVDTAKGSIKYPMTTEEVFEKYHTLAGKVLNRSKDVDRLQDAILSLQDMKNVNDLARILCVEK